ncbi:MAG: universal stress protein [Bacteroidales bacterium]|nr:universal stress protein [Bacteroidales bacterium]MCF8404496.1 universal stress protein [Bacteroidales bacterium]
MKLNNIILVPTDFSDVCKNAIDYAVKLSSLINFKVYIYHVINKDSQAAFSKSASVEAGVTEALNKLVTEFSAAHNVEIEAGFDHGSIFDLVHQKAEDIGANIIFLGTHGKKGMQILFGSYALKVITSAKVPTVVVQHKVFQGIENILFPINTFTEARQKVGYAINISKRFGSTIHIYKERSSEAAEASRIEIISKQIIKEFTKAGIKYTVQHSEKTGESAKRLVEHAIETNMDLIMIVTEPQIGTNYFNLGPWNEKIMFNEAQIPVICINPVELGRVYFDI